MADNHDLAPPTTVADVCAQFERGELTPQQAGEALDALTSETLPMPAQADPPPDDGTAHTSETPNMEKARQTGMVALSEVCQLVNNGTITPADAAELLDALASETPSKAFKDMTAEERHRYLSECGRRGGLSRSVKKRAAFKRNQNKNGQPRKEGPVSYNTAWRRRKRAIEKEMRERREQWEATEKELSIGTWGE